MPAQAAREPAAVHLSISVESHHVAVTTGTRIKLADDQSNIPIRTRCQCKYVEKTGYLYGIDIGVTARCRSSPRVMLAPTHS